MSNKTNMEATIMRKGRKKSKLKYKKRWNKKNKHVDFLCREIVIKQKNSAHIFIFQNHKLMKINVIILFLINVIKLINAKKHMMNHIKSKLILKFNRWFSNIKINSVYRNNSKKIIKNIHLLKKLKENKYNLTQKNYLIKNLKKSNKWIIQFNKDR